MTTRYPRDFLGHGPAPPHPNWPGGANIAVQIVVNYEEGGENNLLHGDPASEAFLSEITAAQPWPGQRHWNMESIYEYGARTGFWRLHRLFTGRRIPITVYGVATALARAPEQVAAMKSADWEIASHGLKWIDYRDVAEDEERRHLNEAIALHAEVTGDRPNGYYLGRTSMNSVRLAAENGGFAYIADSYADDLPYWLDIGGREQLIVPYTLDVNDMRFAIPAGYSEGSQFERYLVDSFDALYDEGLRGAPKMMSVGLHCRLAGRPGRVRGLARFLDHAQSHACVWFARRIDIARHWTEHHAPVRRERPSTMDRAAFVARFGGVYEHSPWVADRAFDLELGPHHDTHEGIASALARAFRRAGDEERLGVLKAHPDLAGKLAEAKRLTDESAGEQASAGLDALTKGERAAFADLNARYTERFGFPFIIAARDHTKSAILEAFRRRLENDAAAEFAEAARQVERIAWHRLKDLT